MITINMLTKDEKDKVKSEIETALYCLYHLEDLTDYEVKEISKCIDILQNMQVDYVLKEVQNEKVKL